MTTARAPGKVLVAGEYAVLDGHPAVVVAVNRFATAQVGSAPAELSPFLAAARAELVRQLGEGSAPAHAAARVVVDTSSLAEGEAKLGLGSSAAATVAAIAVALGKPTSEVTRREIHALAHRAHAAAQEPRGARGSGADVAASTWGGALRVTRHRADACQPVSVERLPWPPDLEPVLVWSGIPADTASLVARVRAFAAAAPTEHAQILARIGRSAEGLCEALAAADCAAAVASVDEGAGALAELAARSGAPLVPPGLSQVAALARAHGGAAKPTGAGGGDILAALFPDSEAADRFRADVGAAGLLVVPAAIAYEGVVVTE